MTPALRELERIFSPGRFLIKPGELVPYESDALTAFRARPLAVVLPETHQEVVQAVQWSARHQLPYVARGSGTSLSGGSLPVAGGLVIGLNRMNKLLRLDAQERIAVVQAGFINLQVSSAAAPYGLYYAPDPSSQPVSTIGGNLAFNSGGAHCLKYGMTSNHVLAARVVLPTSEVVELGSESLEGTGPDWLGLFVGSEGLLGIATEITLRLLPRPEKYHTVLAAYDSLAKAGDAVASVVASGLLPGAIEIMDSLAIEAAEAAVKAGYPREARALLIVELEGETPQVEAEARHLEAVIQASGAYEVRVAQNNDERMKIWKGRKAAFSAVGRLSPDYIVQDGVVPRSKLGQALEEIERLSARHGLRVANVFHAGDGNLHPLILYDGRVAGELELAEELAGEILSLCVGLGGSITGEHGVGMEKKAYMTEMFSEADLALMQRIRRAIDPQELSNRGKMFPGGEAPSLAHQGAHPLEKAGVISRE
jgi:glycolate oxidase